MALIGACGAPAPAAGQRKAEAPAAGESLFAAAASARVPLSGAIPEISGLAVTADGRLLGHDDERAVIREIAPATGEIVRSFAVGDPVVKGDFEGIAVADGGDIYLITSTGALYRFREGANGAHVPYTAVETRLATVCEVEGLAYLRAADSLIVACKEMLGRSMRSSVVLFSWSRRTGRLDARPWRTLPVADLAAAARVDSFHPSSVEIDPASGRVVLLAAREKAMVELGPDGAIVTGRRLGGRHDQAEGAAVMPDGALVIADEATKNSSAQLTRYARRND